MIRNILQYLEKDQLNHPDRIALQDDTESINYADYVINAQKTGTFIINKTNGCTRSPIAVLIDRNIRSICAFMGIVYSGNFYVPLDASMPDERIKLILDTLKPVMIIDAAKNETLSYGAVSYSEIISLTEPDETLLKDVRDNSIDTDPLYCIFTSGSTGVPKGVLVSHRSVIDLVNSFEEAFSFPEGSVFGNQAPFDFDVSVKDIYNSMYTCSTVHVLAKKLFKTPKLLIDYLIDNHIDTLIWAVSALRIVSDFETLEGREAPKLKKIMFSGEVMPAKSLNYWIRHIPDAQYVNLYGPTEITCNCTYHIVDRQYDNNELIPIGKAFSNCRVFLRDEENRLITKDHVTGEICVEGTCLAHGYWNSPEKTAAAFINNPFINSYESRIYASGDLGYYDENHDLIFASRKDYQIKHMGHRIELGEIEASLNAISFITIACCIYDELNEKIICHYQASDECKKEIILELSKKLPKYMWPNVYVRHDELPLNKNGKIDRIKLKESQL